MWLIVDPTSNHAIVVDPGEAQPIFNYLKSHKLNLIGVLITHHHADHIGGLNELRHHFSKHIKIYVPKLEQHKIPTYDLAVTEGDKIDFGFCKFSVLNIPGHTLGHIAYLNKNNLFCGDTLFSGGCGRVFEGTMEQMLNSLNKIKSLPDKIKIYCTHEYTKNNLLFALQAEPHNQDLKNYYQKILSLCENSTPTLPSTLKIEKLINPFLRCSSAEIKQSVAKKFNLIPKNELEIFTYLREWKNNF